MPAPIIIETAILFISALLFVIGVYCITLLNCRLREITMKGILTKQTEGCMIWAKPLVKSNKMLGNGVKYYGY